MVKKVCINCKFAEMLLTDKEYESIADMVADSQNDYLVCTHTFNVVTARNLNNDSGHNLKIEAFKVDDYDTCGMWEKSLSREDDLKMWC